MTITNRIKRAVRSLLESPRVPLSGSNWWTADGRMSAAGTRVNEHTALEVAAVQACVSTLANTIGSMRLTLQKEGAEGHHAEVRHHATGKLLNVAPNPDMTPMTVISTFAAGMILWGNGYLEIQRDSNAQPVSLWPRLPWLCRVKRDNDGTLYFETSDTPDGKYRRIEAENMIHGVGLSLDGLLGIKTIHTARNVIGAALAADVFAGSYFASAGVPAISLSTDKLLKPDQKTTMRQEWLALQTGEGNLHKIAILDQGMKLDQYNVTAQDAQLVEARKLSREDIAMLFHVPLTVLGISDKAPRATAEMQDLQFLKYGIAPHLSRIEQAFDCKLAPTGSYRVKFDVRELLRSDIQARYQSYALGRQWGWLSADDCRAMESLPPLPEGAGNSYLSPLNMATAATVSDDAEAVEEEDES